MFFLDYAEWKHSYAGKQETDCMKKDFCPAHGPIRNTTTFHSEPSNPKPEAVIIPLHQTPDSVLKWRKYPSFSSTSLLRYEVLHVQCPLTTACTRCLRAKPWILPPPPNRTNNLKMGKLSLTSVAPCFPKKGIRDCTQSLQSHTGKREQGLSHFHLQSNLRYKERLILPNWKLEVMLYTL